MRWSRWAVLIAGFVVAGCTSPVGGAALPDPGYTPPRRSESTAQDLIGNANALDPCSLLDPSALEQFGAAQKPEQEAYDYCWLKLPVGSTTVAVRFGLMERMRGELQATEVEPVATLRVFEENPVKDRCARYIMFSDGVTMAVSADTFDTPAATVPELCSIAEKATTTIAENVAAKRMKHLDYPADSLARVDACRAVAVSLAQVPGLPAGEVISYPGRHQCRWGMAMAPSLTVRFVLDEPSTAPEVKTESIAGKQTGIYSSEINGRTICVAEVKHGSSRELAQVIVRLPPNNAEPACAAARVVATEAWSKLPA
ncbi:DUF3558 domain-containing protein [Kibdelosporangium philippinense]|uniref:DUF3558 domain-containing protein n=2 Tax=Kibdelosporangium philippinense TaxID=211113 RepID=A0ABS8ZLJ7_9PSEU|nr:DUF3558 family protein [Kibdelosporangium philippinense]MCE7008023.1 DUF3558 domain-containing protein [Kibdelosporangium philippinense]